MAPPRLPNLIVGGIAVLAAVVAFQSKAQMENEPKPAPVASASNPSTENASDARYSRPTPASFAPAS
jgi:hypothetical protein